MGSLKLGIFSSSRTIQDQNYLVQLEEMGNNLPLNISLFYGGGDAGAMGVIPKIFDYRGGSVTGIDCKKFNEKYGSPSFGKTIVYDSFEERQRQLLEASNVILCLPGGVGTLSELFDVIVSNDLSIKKRKIILFNWQGFFDPIITFIKNNVQKKYITSWEKLDITVADNSLDVKTQIDKLLTVGNL